MDLTARVRAFLQAHQVLTLALLADGAPHAAAVFYAPGPAGQLYFVTDPATRHGRALLVDPVVAGTIQRDRQDWRQLQGLQFRGRCRRLRGLAREPAWAQYVARYPFLAHRGPRLLTQLAAAVGRAELWELELDWVRLIDNRRGFGHQSEWTRPGATSSTAP